MSLNLSPDLALPDSFATEGVVAVGMRGSGKSNTLVRWAEVLYKARIPFVTVDPKGDWYGVKSSADGKAAGLSVPVFGGLHGDGPLTEDMGAAIADLLVDNNMSAVLDVSKLSIAKRAVFLTAFCNRLMERHQAEPHVRCVIFEEAHRYIPQQVGGGPAAALKEAAAAILLEGRSFGLGCWAATQRPARLHKDVLEEVGTAFLHRIGAAATNDLRTVGGWVKHEGHADDIIPTLTSLPSGEAWVVAPATLGIAKRVRVDRRTTFDSAATPLVGAGSRPTLTLADVDMDAITAALAGSIEKAKESDPAELRKRIKALERQVAEHQPEEITVEVPVEVPVVPEGLLDEILHLEGFLRDATTEFAAHASKAVSALIDSVKATPDRPSRSTQGSPHPEGPRPAAKRGEGSGPRQPRPAAPARAEPVGGGTNLPGPQRKLLTVLAVYGPRTKRQLAMQAGYSAKGGGFNNPLSSLRSGGLVERGDPIVITQAGLDALGDYEPLPTGQALVDHWLGQLSGPEKRILQPLIDTYPGTMSKEDLADAAGYAPVGGGFNNPLSRLRSLELVRRGVDIGLTEDFGEAIRE